MTKELNFIQKIYNKMLASTRVVIEHIVELND
jgi:hypothetical protein